MGRIRSGGTAASNNSGGLQTLATTLTTGEPVQQGDILLLGLDDNRCYIAANPAAPAVMQRLRPPAGGPAIENAPIVAADKFSGGTPFGAPGTDSYESLRLNNGNILHVWSDTSAARIKLAIISPDGGIVLPETPVPGATTYTAGGGCPSAGLLANGGFVVAYGTSTGTIVATVFDIAGTITTPQFVVDSNTTSTASRVAVLANGNFVTVSRHNAVVRYSIFKVDGTAVKASTVLESSTNQPFAGDRSIGVAALAGGGFVAVYGVQNGTMATEMRYMLYNAAGVSQGSYGTMFSVNGSTTGACLYVVALTGGGFAYAGHCTGSGFKLAIYDANATLQGGLIALGSGSDSSGNQLSLAAASNGDVGVAMASGGLKVARYSPTGTAVVPAVTLDSSASSASITFNADGGVTAAASSASAIKVFQLNASLAPVASVLVLQFAAPTYGRVFACAVTSTLTAIPCVYVAFQWNASSNAMCFGIYFRYRQGFVLTGIAMASAGANAAIPTQIMGIAAVRVGFSMNWATNQNGASPPGQRMHVVGNTAILQGIQPQQQLALN